MAWTDEKVKQLKKLWVKGKSTIEIAKELGMSKNSVIGKVHRLDLTARPSPIKKKQGVQKAVRPVLSDKCRLMDLRTNTCRWPIGDPSDDDFHFCGHPTTTGKPYCPEHCKAAYTSLKELAEQNAKEKSLNQKHKE